MCSSRLFVERPLGGEQLLFLDRGKFHYLARVMRIQVGECLLLFNGHDGEWVARVESVGRSSIALRCETQTRKQDLGPDIWLLFAPLKKSRTDFAVEKATEIGVASIIPVGTEFTNSGRVSKYRLSSLAQEAAEQCGGLAVPEIHEFTPLKVVLGKWPQDRLLLFCDEIEAGAGSDWNSLYSSGGWAVLVGPEGGFSPDERELLRGLQFTRSMSLGNRILRAETAVSVALALLHAFLRQGFRK